MKTKLLISAFAIASLGGLATAQVVETDETDAPVMLETETTTETVIETETTDVEPVTNADYVEEGDVELEADADEDAVEVEFEAEDEVEPEE